MENTIASITSALLAEGISGLIILALSIVIYVLWRELKAERDKTSAIQEKRIAEGKETALALQNSSNTVNSLSTQLLTLLSARQ